MLLACELFAGNAVFVGVMSVSEIQGHPAASSSPVREHKILLVMGPSQLQTQSALPSNTHRQHCTKCCKWFPVTENVDID